MLPLVYVEGQGPGILFFSAGPMKTNNVKWNACQVYIVRIWRISCQDFNEHEWLKRMIVAVK